MPLSLKDDDNVRELYVSRCSTEEEARDRGRFLEFVEELEATIWAGDVDKLDELAGCGCCCSEHWHSGCPARIWGGCRGGYGGETRENYEAWFKHYERFHGFTRGKFDGSLDDEG